MWLFECTEGTSVSFEPSDLTVVKEMVDTLAWRGFEHRNRDVSLSRQNFPRSLEVSALAVGAEDIPMSMEISIATSRCGNECNAAPSSGCPCPCRHPTESGIDSPIATRFLRSNGGRVRPISSAMEWFPAVVAWHMAFTAAGVFFSNQAMHASASWTVTVEFLIWYALLS